MHCSTITGHEACWFASKTELSLKSVWQPDFVNPTKVNSARASPHGATLDDIHEAVATLEETEQTGRRVLGSAHPNVVLVEKPLRNARAALRARETPPQNAVDALS